LRDQNLNIRAIAPVRLANDEGARQTKPVAVTMPGVDRTEKADIGVAKRRRIERRGRGQETFLPGPTCYTRFRAPVAPVVLLGEVVQEAATPAGVG
jgi:hypothetical protein